MRTELTLQDELHDDNPVSYVEVHPPRAAHFAVIFPESVKDESSLNGRLSETKLLSGIKFRSTCLLCILARVRKGVGFDFPKSCELSSHCSELFYILVPKLWHL